MNVGLVMEDVSKHSLIDNNQVLITRGKMPSQKYFLYDVISGEVRFLDTEIRLTEPAEVR